MPTNLLKLKNYEVHSVGSSDPSTGRMNFNIVTWAMQSAMQAKRFTVALYKTDYTIELVKASGMLNLCYLSENQANLINKLGRKSGRNSPKLKNLPFECDARGCPFLLDSLGYIQGSVVAWVDSLDHELAVCAVEKFVPLNVDLEPLKLNYLRERKLVRG